MDAPFIQLSPTQSHVSDSSSSTGDNESQSTTLSSASSASTSPGLSTHNTKRATYHVKDIAEFARTLEISADRAFPNRGITRYKRVEALLLRWEEDELGVESELKDLAQVFRNYKFNTETWLIPTEDPLIKVMGKALQFVTDYQSEDTLLIVYYGGHAKINEARQSTWSCQRNLAYSSFEWNGCQALFEQSKSDTLLLLDCCAAAAAATTVPCRTNSITEIIAACGWETWAPIPGYHSFTRTLIEVLEDWMDGKAFSAAMLHCEVLSILKQSRPRRHREYNKTPVYIVSTSNPRTCSIELARRQELIPSSLSAIDSVLSSNEPQAGISTEPGLAESGQNNPQASTNHADKFDLASLLATLPDKTFVLPHVILSVALEEDQILDLDGFQRWMATFPALAKYARFEGVYPSHSTLVLLTIPVVIWNLLPEHPAVNFVGYARAGNLLGSSTPVHKTNDEILTWVEDDASSHASWDSFETLVPVNTATLAGAMLTKHITLRQRTTQPSSPAALKRISLQRSNLVAELKNENIDFIGPLGLNPLHIPPPELVVADIVFVHGLGGGSTKTWMKNHDLTSFWPKEWLPRDKYFQNVRLHSFGYDSMLFGKVDLLAIDDSAEALLAGIQDAPHIPKGCQKPLLFVCHSMGGIVVKAAYIKARQSPALSSLGSRVKGIFFLATPHRGANLAQAFAKIAGAVRIKPSIPDLLHNSLAIAAINDEFATNCHSLRIYSFHETIPSSIGLKKALVVDQNHATLGVANEISRRLTADHRGICKYDTVSDPNYIKIRHTLASAIADIKAEEEEAQQRVLIDFLGARGDIENDFFSVESLRTHGSCEWLMAKPSFQEWRDSSDSMRILWLKAPPASGKTFLSCAVIDHLRRDSLDCSFYFFKHGSKAEDLTISALLLSIAWQMSRADPQVLSAVDNAFKTHKQLRKMDAQIIWRRLFLDGIFQDRSRKPSYWVIDAVDECLAGDTLLRMFSKVPTGTLLRIFFTSRNTITSYGFPAEIKVASEEIQMEDTKSDIKLYLDANIDEYVFTSDIQARKDLVDEILFKSAGNFLWVTSVLQGLRNAHNESEIRMILEAVPQGIGDLYSSILAKWSSHASYGKELVKSALRWIVCSRRPLTTDELHDALCFDLDDNIGNLERVLHLCQPLVCIDSQSRVQMMHQTAREYLLRDDLDSEFAVTTEVAHTRIFLACMKYLNILAMKRPLTPGNKNAWKRNSFAAYACTRAFEHMNYASSTEDQVILKLRQFLTSRNVLVWIEYLANRPFGLRVLVEAGNALGHFSSRRSQETQARSGDDLMVYTWSTDLVRLVGKFGKYLLDLPPTIYTIIPPLCPQETSIFNLFGSSGRCIGVHGSLKKNWDDCVSTTFAPQDRYTVLACSDLQFAIGMASGKISVYDSSTYQCVTTLQQQDAVTTLKFSQNSGTLAAASLRSLHVWDLTAGTLLWTFHMPSCCIALEFMESDQILLSAFNDYSLITWDLLAGIALLDQHLTRDDDENQDKQTTTIAVHESRRPISAKFCIECHLLAVCHESGDIVLWAMGGVVTIVGTCSRDVQARPLCFTINHVSGSCLLTASYADGFLVVFDTFDGQSIERKYAELQTLACSPNHQFLAGVDPTGIISIFEAQTLQLLYQVQTEHNIQQLEFSGDSRALLDIRGSWCQVWSPSMLSRADLELDEDRSTSYQNHPTAQLMGESSQYSADLGIITSMSLHSNGRDIFVGKADGSVCLYDGKSGKEVRELFRHGNSRAICSLQYDKISETLLSVDESNWIMLHYCPDLQNSSKGVECTFNQNSSEAIHQVLGHIGHARILVSSNTKDTLWMKSSGGEWSARTIEWKYRKSFMWIHHPLDSDQLILIVDNVLHLSEWSTLIILTFSCGILLEKSWHPTFNIRSKKPYSGNGYFATLFEDTATSPGNVSGYLWHASDLLDDTTFAVRMQASCTLEQVHHLIGFYKQSFVYLCQDGWICSIDLRTKAIKRHFFFPIDWLSTNAELILDVTSKGDVLFAKQGELVVISGGLEKNFVVEPKGSREI